MTEGQGHPQILNLPESSRMAALIQSHDWGNTPLGEVSAWPPSLWTALHFCLNAPFPMAIAWGEQLIVLYNDAWRSLPDNQYPQSLGQPAEQVWSSDWTWLGPQLQHVLKASQTSPAPKWEAASDRASKLPQWRYTYSPIYMESGMGCCSIGGVLITVAQPASMVNGDGAGLAGAMNSEKLDPSEAASPPLSIQTSERLQHLAANVPGVVYQFVRHADGTIEFTYLSPRCRELLEVSWDDRQLAAHSSDLIWSLTHPDDRERVRWANQQAFERGEPFDLEFRVVTPTGRLKWVRATSQPSQQPNGTVIYTGLILEITDRKQTEAALRCSEERFRLATRAVDGLVFDWNIQTDEVYRSEGLYRLCGIYPETVEAGGDWWRQRIHPADLHQLEAFWCNTLATADDRYECEYRIRHQDGHWVNVWERGYLVRDQSGQVVRVVGSTSDITARRRTEAILREAEDRLRLALESANLGTWDFNPSTGQFAGDDCCKAMFGLLSNQDLRYEDLLACVHPADRSRIEQASQQALQPAHGQFEQEYRVIGIEDQVERWIAAKGKAFFDANGQPIRFIGTVLDITDRKRSELALQNSEERYRFLSENIPQLVWTCLPDGRCDYWNRQFYEFTGWGFDRIKDFGWVSLLHPDDFQRCLQEWQTCLNSGEMYRTELRYRHLDGSYRWVLCQALPMCNEQGQIVKWFGTSTDIHDQKQLEEEREMLLRREQTAREQAETANRIKDEFLAVLSHELRSPLNPILGWTRLLQTRQFDSAATQRALEIIERNAKLQTQLIEDLLDVSRILRGKMTLNVYPVELAPVIQGAIETVRLAAEAKGITIQTHLTTATVSGDSARLQQIVWNLLSNAVKFTPASGQIKVSLMLVAQPAETGLFTVDGAEEHRDQAKSDKIGYAQITVEDNGKGINLNFLPYVFDYFRQEDSKTTRQFGGLGLGLAIVRYLTELHGGTIQAHSAGEGKGAAFILRLPLLAPAKTVECHPIDRVPLSPASLQGVQILAVDDEPDMRELLQTLLQEFGAQVQLAASATEALQQLESYQPDILISDIGMPDMDGYMLMRQVRSRSTQLPAIALTAYAGEFDQRQAIIAGFQRHVAKPIEPECLVQAILGLVER